MPEETRAVRESETLDWASLTTYLHAHLPPHAWRTATPTRIEQFGGGHSNLTYLLAFGELELVLRRPPLGPVPARAHDMAREFRWLSALHPLFPLAPRPWLLCEDLAVIGSVFYVMERRHGLVIRHDEPPGIDGQPEVRHRIGLSLVDTLADLHRVDASLPALAALGKPAGFVTRQVRGWTERWQAARTDDITNAATIEAVAAWLATHLPPEPARPTVVHGDFKLDNVMLATTPPHAVVAVLDWEMCALGDPLVDLGIFLGYWLPTPGSERGGRRDALSTVTNRAGYPDRQAVLDRYARRTAADLSHLGFYEAFAVFKLAVVLQQIYVRYVRGQTDDARFAGLGARVDRLAVRAAAVVDRQS